MINQLAIIGLGLMGGSLAKAAKKYNACKSIIAFDLNQHTLKQSLADAVIDHAATSPAKAAQHADLIMLATPVNTSKNIFSEIANHCSAHAVISDMGSCKLSVISAAKDQLKHAYSQFVPGHPMAGSEKSGLTAANAELYFDKTIILTPTDKTKQESLEKLRQFWQKIHAKVITMPAEKHDQLVAFTSHLPHILAIAFMNSMSNEFSHDDLLAGIGGGFKDFTRIASADPTMWADICLANKAAITDKIAEFETTLLAFRQALANDDNKKLLEIIAQAKQRREDLLS